MKAADMMTLGAATMRSDASIAQPAQLMLPYCISGLLVVDATEDLVGIVRTVTVASLGDRTAENAKPATLEP